MTNRRTFLNATAGALWVAPARALSMQAEKIKVALVGCGWYGMVDLKAAFKAGGIECVALCDVDSEHLEASAVEVEALQGTRPKTFSDYREMLEEPGLQALFIGTPPHWHALQFVAACEKGLDVYCEKPLAYDIREGRAMVTAAEKAGNIVQVGFQRRQGANFRAAGAYIRAGNAGRIVQVDVNIHYQAATPDTTPREPPPSLDWETWCGPAPKLPYSLSISHKVWRLEAAYGNGHLVDWGIHLIDATRTILGETMPRSVTAVGGLYEYKGKITTPDTLTAHFEFDQCPVVWRHRLWGAAEYDRSASNGIFFFGEKETIFVTDQRWEIIPRGQNPERKVMEEKGAPPGEAQVAEFLEAVRSRKQPSCRPADAFRSTATVQLGMIAYNTRERVDWDMASEKITSSDKANAMLMRAYRPPYRHPGLG